MCWETRLHGSEGGTPVTACSYPRQTGNPTSSVSGQLVVPQGGLMVGARTFPGNPLWSHSPANSNRRTPARSVGRSRKKWWLIWAFVASIVTIPRWSHSSRQSVAAATAPLAQATTGGGASNWPSQVGSPDGSLLAPRTTGDACCRAVCYRLQPALVAAGYAPSGPKATFLRPVLLLLIALLSTMPDPTRSLRISA